MINVLLNDSSTDGIVRLYMGPSDAGALNTHDVVLENRAAGDGGSALRAGSRIGPLKPGPWGGINYKATDEAGAAIAINMALAGFKIPALCGGE
jgi:hypothetical protein